MNKWKTTIISLGITVLFAIACYFMPERIDLLWTAVISVMTFLISFVFIELLEHTRLIRYCLHELSEDSSPNSDTTDVYRSDKGI